MMAITLHAENWEFVVTLVTNNALYVIEYEDRHIRFDDIPIGRLPSGSGKQLVLRSRYTKTVERPSINCCEANSAC